MAGLNEKVRLAFYYDLRIHARLLRPSQGALMIEGVVEQILPGSVRGWCYEPEQPDRSVSVTIRVDGREVKTVLADVFRMDLFEAGKGNGCHVFEAVESAIEPAANVEILAEGAPLPILWNAKGGEAQYTNQLSEGARNTLSEPSRADDKVEMFDCKAPDGGNPRKEWYWRYKRGHFSQVVNPSLTKGLEIGPLDLPMIEQEEGHCDFADFYDQAFLENMIANSSGNSVRFLAPIKYVLRFGYKDVPKDYDWIAAAHVIEHIPDVVGWLHELESHLTTGGVLFLTIPNKDYIFDRFRHPTTFTQLIARHRARLVRPSFEQAFDAKFFFSSLSTTQAWTEKSPPGPEKNYLQSLAFAENAEIEYNDVHCSVFNPSSFHDLISNLIESKLISFRLHSIRDTRYGGNDFTVALIKS